MHLPPHSLQLSKIRFTGNRCMLHSTALVSTQPIISQCSLPIQPPKKTAFSHPTLLQNQKLKMLVPAISEILYWFIRTIISVNFWFIVWRMHQGHKRLHSVFGGSPGGLETNGNRASTPSSDFIIHVWRLAESWKAWKRMDAK